MANLPDTPNVVRVNLKGLNQSLKWQNTLHLQFAGGSPTTAQLNTLAGNVGAAWLANLAPQLITAVSLTTVECIDLTTRTSNVGSDSTIRGGALAGTNPLPVNAAICVSEHINNRFRGGHPRFYLPAPTVTQMAGGNLLNSGYRTALQAAAEAFRVALDGLAIAPMTFDIVAVRYFHDKGQAYATGQPFPVTAFNVHLRLDTQRRRLGKEVP